MNTPFRQGCLCFLFIAKDFTINLLDADAAIIKATDMIIKALGQILVVTMDQVKKGKKKKKNKKKRKRKNKKKEKKNKTIVLINNYRLELCPNLFKHSQMWCIFFVLIFTFVLSIFKSSIFFFSFVLSFFFPPFLCFFFCYFEWNWITKGTSKKAWIFSESILESGREQEVLFLWMPREDKLEL